MVGALVSHRGVTLYLLLGAQLLHVSGSGQLTLKLDKIRFTCHLGLSVATGPAQGMKLLRALMSPICKMKTIVPSLQGYKPQFKTKSA